MKKALIIFLFLITGHVYGQGIINIKQKNISLPADTIRVDSVSLIPGSISLIYPDGSPVHDSLYFIDPNKSILIPSELLNNTSEKLQLTYRTFPVSWLKPVYHKNPDFNRIDPVSNRIISSARPPDNINPFNSGQLISNGSISRGIMVGNTRDPSLSSNLNLQINGKINKDFFIEASLSDASIPIQPEGNTRQIQDFDRLYLKLYNQDHEILGGDFVLESPKGYFLKMNKKVQGAMVKSHLHKSEEGNTKIKTGVSAALVKGKYTINKIQGQEGNQGPYRLSGQNGENYIQIIAGSEKIYIDGKLLERGENFDYVIDYNTAELRFTPKTPITRDKRISAEFEYTEQSYARFLVSNSTEWERKNGNWYLNFFSENDAKNQSLLQDLTEDNKRLLRNIGDNTSSALVPNYYPVEFSNDRILYKLTDSIVNGVYYDSILVYSNSPDSAHYQAGFSFAGNNQGNYMPVNTSANGQVYKWIAPLNGIPQGSYKPYKKLLAPQSKQVYSIGGKERIGKRSEFNMEVALTRNDLNTFSDLDRSDNIGYGLTTGLHREDPLGKDSTWLLESRISYRRTNNSFNPLERYREVEFDRDWNINDRGNMSDENFLTSEFSFTGKDSIEASYRLEYLSYSGNYKALRNLSSGNLAKNNWSLNWDASLLNSTSDVINTRFGRHRIELSRLIKTLKIFASENHESNLWNKQHEDQLQDGSFRFQEWNFGLENSEKGKIPWHIHINKRSDYTPEYDNLVSDSRAWQINSGINLKGKKSGNTAISINWRKLDMDNERSMILDNVETGQSLTGRVEENFQIKNGGISSRTFYEIGSGLERKMEFTYIQVSPGQGHYSWTDYNQNGITELDEFEPANFKDEADYIRVFRPGTNYIPSYVNRFNQTLSLNPGRFFREETKARNLMTRFSNTLAYRIDRKTYRDKLSDQLNPFRRLNDSLLVSNNAQIRNTLSFNKTNPLFGADYQYEQNEGQVLLSYGTDKRNNKLSRLIFRVKPHESFWINNKTELGVKKYNSSFFSSKNYNIGYRANNIELSLKTGNTWQFTLGHEWRDEESRASDERMAYHKITSGTNFQMPGKGQIMLSLNYINIEYKGDPNTPQAYVMLRGFQPGHNGLLNLSIRRKLNKLIQADIVYEGRISQGGKLVHTGNVQIRAVF